MRPGGPGAWASVSNGAAGEAVDRPHAARCLLQCAGMSFTEVMERITQVFESLGALVLVGGLLVCVALAVRAWQQQRDGTAAYRVLRRSFGAVILLGLEILVAADLVRTVAIAPTLQNILILAVIVLIRTLLSFSLEVEIEGVAPWKRALLPGMAGRRTPGAGADDARP